jgi:hypothetical protein
VVQILLAVKRDATDPMPHVWWEDSALHPQSSGYVKLLWSGDVTYGIEESIGVPKESWCPEFATAIEERLAELGGRIESWYLTAEVRIATPDA